MIADDGLCGTGRALAPADPRPPPRRGALRERPRRAPHAQPARRLEAPEGAARRRARRGAAGGAAALVPPARPAARRGRRVARALPRPLVEPAGRPRTTPGGEPMMSGTLETVDGRPALRFERRLAHPVERVWRAVTDPDEMPAWFPSGVVGERAVGAELVFA